ATAALPPAPATPAVGSPAASRRAGLREAAAPGSTARGLPARRDPARDRQGPGGVPRPGRPVARRHARGAHLGAPARLPRRRFLSRRRRCARVLRAVPRATDRRRGLMLCVRRITLREIRLPLKEPFRISSGVSTERRICLLELESADGGGPTGWSECVAGEQPNYSDETIDTAWLAIRAW